jgi:hypothetical protein
MSENSRQIVPTGPVSAELAMLGSRKEIREIVRRIKTQAPGGMKLNDLECLTLAQYSVSLGANPLVGEAWLLKNESTGKVLGVMPGIRLYRRRADEKDERTGDSRWMEADIISDPDEKIRLGVPADAFLAVKVRLYRQSQTKPFSEMVTAMGNAGAPWERIELIAGTKPYITGVGYLTKAEQASLEKAGERNKMPPYQRALKRAEAHALKQAYSLPFGFVAMGDGNGIPEGAILEDYIIESEWKDVTPPEAHPEDAAKGSETLFGGNQNGTPAPEPEKEPDPEPLTDETIPSRPYEPEELQLKIVAASGIHAQKGTDVTPGGRGVITGVLNRIFAGPNADDDRRALLRYLFNIQSSKALLTSQWAALGTWLKIEKDSGGQYVPCSEAAIEAVKVVDAMILAGSYVQPQPGLPA